MEGRLPVLEQEGDLKELQVHDALGSARSFLEKPTPERYRYVVDDARTAIFEALTSHGHLSVIESSWNPVNEGFEIGGVLYRDMLQSGIYTAQHPVEIQRRRIEQKEEELIEDLYKTGRLKGHALLTISPYPEEMSDFDAKNNGYRPDNRKYKLRWVEVDDFGDRKTEELNMSGSDNQLFARFYNAMGYDLGANPTHLEVLSAPMLVDKNQINKVEEAARILDKLTEKNVLFGSENNNFSVTHENVRAISKYREEKVKSEIIVMADQLINIARLYPNGIKAFKEYEKYLLNTIGAICLNQPEYANYALGNPASDYLKLAKAHMDRGQISHAIELYESAMAKAEIIVCGMRIAEEGETNFENSSNTMKCVTCPFCKNTVDAIVTPKKIKCPSCEKEVNR